MVYVYGVVHCVHAAIDIFIFSCVVFLIYYVPMTRAFRFACAHSCSSNSHSFGFFVCQIRIHTGTDFGTRRKNFSLSIVISHSCTPESLHAPLLLQSTAVTNN